MCFSGFRGFPPNTVERRELSPRREYGLLSTRDLFYSPARQLMYRALARYTWRRSPGTRNGRGFRAFVGAPRTETSGAAPLRSYVVSNGVVSTNPTRFLITSTETTPFCEWFLPSSVCKQQYARRGLRPRHAR